MPIRDFESPRNPSFPKRRRVGRLLLLALPLALLTVLGGFWSGRSTDPETGADLLAIDPLAEGTEEVPVPPDTLTAEPEPEWTEIVGRIRSRESFWDALKREGVPREQIFDLLTALKKGVPRAEFNPRIVQKGDRYRLELDSLGAIQAFDYVKRGAIETRFVARRENGALVAHRERFPLDREVVVVSGEIRDMLWNALAAAGENPAVLSDKMTDIFEYYVDFMVDCRVGDRFALAVEKFYKDGQFVRYGDILSAEYRAARESHRAFLYETPDGDAAYYDAEGKSLRGLFLKSPLNYRRISSGYTSRRFHPILKKYIPHHGIDYAADYGDPIWATAAGTIAFIGRKGALGNYIEIRHKNGYKTGYGHLSKFRRGLKRGAYVKQKQVIGYVGATGRATGPHVHYNFFVRRDKAYRLINPAQVVNRPTGNPVPETLRLDFTHKRDRLWALLDRSSGAVVTALLDAEMPAGGPAPGAEQPRAATTR